ncbi:MAG: lipoprotein [Thiothrix sp.]|nr:lipoprotein [Thiothrix sp.]HPQ96603.1 lipoprotein [Thiolinea sp.]
MHCLGQVAPGAGLLLAVALMLSACGNRGPLYLPEEAPPATPAASRFPPIPLLKQQNPDQETTDNGSF